MSCIKCRGGCKTLVECPYLGIPCGGGYTEKQEAQFAFARACVLRAQRDGITVEEAHKHMQEAMEAMKKEAMEKKAVPDPTIGKRAVEK